MLLAYRIVYFIIDTLLLINLLDTHYFGAVPTSTLVLKPAFAVALCANLILVVAFSRIPARVLWIAISVWQILFTWYAWLSPGAPFIVALENRLLAGVLFGALTAWFCSLPLVRTIHQRYRVAN